MTLVGDVGLVVPVLGAESTGKSTLVQALAARWREQHPGWRVAVVDETLRSWCASQRRTPHKQEQRIIMALHGQRIAHAAAAHHVVLCDTSPLQTAVYSQVIFGDLSLYEQALAWHRQWAPLSLLMALDLPWTADTEDPPQRDGPHMQAPVDAALRLALQGSGLAFSVISGAGGARLQQAWAASAGVRRRQLDRMSPAQRPYPRHRSAPPLFTGLDQDVQAHQGWPAWHCACCSVPEFERALATTAAVLAPKAADVAPPDIP